MLGVSQCKSREEPGLIPAMVNSVASYLIVPHSVGYFIRFIICLKYLIFSASLIFIIEQDIFASVIQVQFHIPKPQA